MEDQFKPIITRQDFLNLGFGVEQENMPDLIGYGGINIYYSKLIRTTPFRFYFNESNGFLEVNVCNTFIYFRNYIHSKKDLENVIIFIEFLKDTYNEPPMVREIIKGTDCEEIVTNMDYHYKRKKVIDND